MLQFFTSHSVRVHILLARSIPTSREVAGDAAMLTIPTGRGSMIWHAMLPAAPRN